jgi:hypothetical protein
MIPYSLKKKRNTIHSLHSTVVTLISVDQLLSAVKISSPCLVGGTDERWQVVLGGFHQLCTTSRAAYVYTWFMSKLLSQFGWESLMDSNIQMLSLIFN